MQGTATHRPLSVITLQQWLQKLASDLRYEAILVLSVVLLGVTSVDAPGVHKAPFDVPAP